MAQSPQGQAADERPIVVLGAGGMLATALVNILDGGESRYFALSEQDLDITLPGRVSALLKGLNPRIIVNAAAYTDVDGAEKEKQKAFAVNGEGPGHLAEFCRRNGARLIHVSTDYVFDGKKSGAYEPSDPVNPLNVYGASKLEGEKQIRQRTDDFLIVRTSWLFGPRGRNFVTTMLGLGRERGRLSVVDDQRGSPTYTGHLADELLRLAEQSRTGILHLTNSDHCTWCEFAREIFSAAGMAVQVDPVTSEAFPRPARRPANSILDCGETYRLLGRPMPSWKEGLRQYLGEIGCLA